MVRHKFTEEQPERCERTQDIFLDTAGREIPDPTPMAPPVGYKKQPSMVDHIRSMVRSELLRQSVAAEGLETFEEAEDFDVGDDYDPTTPYEAVFDPPPPAPETPPAAPAAAPSAPPAAPPSDGPAAPTAPSAPPAGGGTAT